MQYTKLRSLYTTDTNKLRMHMRNNKTLRTREFKDQSNEIIKNNLKINEDTCMNKKNRNMQLTPNLKLDTRLKQKT